MNIMWLQITSFIYICLLVIIYFSNMRLNTDANRIYKALMISNVFGLVLEIGCFITVINLDKIPITNAIFTRGLLIYYLIWILLFTKYVFIITPPNYKEKNRSVNSNQIKLYNNKCNRFIITYFIINALVISVLPLFYYNDGKCVYSYGPAVDWLMAVYAILIVIWCIILVKNWKEIRSKKYLPIWLMIILATIVGIIQKVNPTLLLTTPLQTLITFLMYFTIENPDLQMLREFHRAREYADNLNSEKSQFLFNLVNEVKAPIQTINRVSKESLMEDDITRVKDHVNDIKYTSNNLLELVDKVLDINNLEKRKITVRQNKYNVELLFRSVSSNTNLKAKNKDIEFRFNYDKSIPTNLYGDAVRLRQVVNVVLDNAIENTDEGFVELYVNFIIRHDICRLIITIEDSSKGMSQEEVENLFKVEEIEKDIEKIDAKEISLGLVKKILDLIGGTIIVKSEIGKGTKYGIIIDQEIVDASKTEVIKAVEKYEELYTNNKRVLIVMSNEEEQKKINKLLKKYPLDIVNVYGGQSCLERIRNKEVFDLIIMEDEMPKLSSEDTLAKLQKIEEFKTPVIMFTHKIEINIKKDYMEKGFNDVYVMPISKEDIKEIVNKYILDEKM